MCKKDKFSLVNDFPWYVSILVELAMMHGSSHGEEVASQIIEVALRVETVRPFAVESMLTLLFNQTLFNSQAHITVAEVMRAAAWIVGEYSEVVTAIADDDLEPDDESIDSDIDDEEGYWIEGAQGEEIRSEWRGQDVHSMIIKILLHPRSIELPIHVQRVFLQSIMKVFVRASLDCQEGTIAEIVRVIRERMFAFVQVSTHNLSLCYAINDSPNVCSES